MSGKRVNRILLGAAISAVATLGMVLPVSAQAPVEKDNDRQERHQRDGRGERPEQREAAPQDRSQRNEDEHKAQRQRQADQKEQHDQRSEQRRAQKEKRDQDRSAQKERREQQRRAQKEKEKEKQEQERSARNRQNHQERPVSDQRRKQLDAEQRNRMAVHRKQEHSRDRVWSQREAALQKQNRSAQYRFEQQYQERRRQQTQEWNARSYDYRNDPRFYSAANYHYSRGGQRYWTNQYGADSLRQAVNYGYQQGFSAGQADRQDGWRTGGYRGSYAYQDGDYGYNGYYVNRDEYRHYFREGFSRGYGDGYNSRSQYGSGSGDDLTILSAVLLQILNLGTY